MANPIEGGGAGQTFWQWLKSLLTWPKEKPRNYREATWGGQSVAERKRMYDEGYRR